MITATIRETKVVRGIATEKKYIKCYHSLDVARKELRPIAKEMEVARQLKREPKISIVAVSYDSKSEKNLLLEMRAIITTENEV